MGVTQTIALIDIFLSRRIGGSGTTEIQICTENAWKSICERATKELDYDADYVSALDQFKQFCTDAGGRYQDKQFRTALCYVFSSRTDPVPEASLGGVIADIYEFKDNIDFQCSGKPLTGGPTLFTNAGSFHMGIGAEDYDSTCVKDCLESEFSLIGGRDQYWDSSLTNPCTGSPSGFFNTYRPIFCDRCGGEYAQSKTHCSFKSIGISWENNWYKNGDSFFDRS